MSNATTTNGKAPSQDVVAVIVGALAAMGYSADQIAHIRPIVATIGKWKAVCVVIDKIIGYFDNPWDYSIYMCKIFISFV